MLCLAFERNALSFTVDVKSRASVNLWWLAAVLTLPSLYSCFPSPSCRSRWVSSSFSPHVLEQKVNNCDVVSWMCQSGPVGGSAVVSAKPGISFLNLISYKTVCDSCSLKILENKNKHPRFFSQ